MVWVPPLHGGHAQCSPDVAWLAALHHHSIDNVVPSWYVPFRQLQRVQAEEDAVLYHPIPPTQAGNANLQVQCWILLQKVYAQGHSSQYLFLWLWLPQSGLAKPVKSSTTWMLKSLGAFRLKKEICGGGWHLNPTALSWSSSCIHLTPRQTQCFHNPSFPKSPADNEVQGPQFIMCMLCPRHL